MGRIADQSSSRADRIAHQPGFIAAAYGWKLGRTTNSEDK